MAVWGSGPECRAALRAVGAHGPARLIAVDDSAGFCHVPWSGEPAPLAGGDHAYPALVTAEVVVRTAAIPSSHAWLADLRELGVAVTTGSSLWMVDHAAQTIAVTGGDGRSATAALVGHLFAALGRPVAGGGEPLALPEAGEYVIELEPARCAGLSRSPRVAVVTSLAEGVLGLIESGPELIVVDGTDVGLRDAIRGVKDVNGFPPVPVAAEDSRFRVEDDKFFCSDEPLFPRGALRSTGESDGRALCVALAVLDGVGIDVPGTRDDIRTALESATL